MAEHDGERFESCSICGRTILRGERVSEYVAPDGGRHGVCALCRERAEASGWIPAELARTEARPAQRRGRGLALRERLSRAAELVRAPRPEADQEKGPPAAPPAAPKPGPQAQPEGTREPQPGSESAEGGRGRQPAAPRRERAAARPQEPAPGQPEPAAPKRPRPAVPDTPERRMRRAVERFNGSDQARVVAGLIRSLGEPHASVRVTSTKPPRVGITVAWELSWYRWEVALDADADGVRELAKGSEISELEEGETRWNAAVDDDGRMRLAGASAGASQASRDEEAAPE